MHRLLTDAKGLGAAFEYLFGALLDQIRIQAPGQDDGEFVTAGAEQQILVADAVAQTICSFPQQPVAAGKAERGIHLLEPVQPEHHEGRARPVLQTQFDGLAQALDEQGSHRQAGHDVVAQRVQLVDDVNMVKVEWMSRIPDH